MHDQWRGKDVACLLGMSRKKGVIEWGKCNGGGQLYAIFRKFLHLIRGIRMGWQGNGPRIVHLHFIFPEVCNHSISKASITIVWSMNYSFFLLFCTFARNFLHKVNENQIWVPIYTSHIEFAHFVIIVIVFFACTKDVEVGRFKGLQSDTDNVVLFISA